MIKAVIFDMDGVLIDAKEWHYESLNLALKEYGYTITRDEHLDRYDGLPISQKLKMLSKEKQLCPSLYNDIAELKQKFTFEMIEKYCAPYQAHIQVLSYLKENGYLIGLASNSIRKTVELMMKKSQLIDFFDVILSNQDVSQPKPSPEIYLKAMQSLQVEPKSCLVIEDNEHGIKAANAAKANVMVVKHISDVNLENITSHINSLNQVIQAVI